HKISLGKYKRSVKREGENLQAVWSPDAKFIAVLVPHCFNSGFCVLLTISSLIVANSDVVFIVEGSNGNGERQAKNNDLGKEKVETPQNYAVALMDFIYMEVWLGKACGLVFWQSLDINRTVNGWDEEVNWLVKLEALDLVKKEIVRVNLVATVYFIWEERN
ncbi:hypothetical protein GIB67_041589, partial [Kingdonia uniflora]